MIRVGKSVAAARHEAACQSMRQPLRRTTGLAGPRAEPTAARTVPRGTRRPGPLAAAPAWLSALVLLAGCTTPPSTRLHTLLPAATPAGPDVDGPKLSIALAPVVVPAQVDRPQWLVRLPDATLALLEYDRWASPLPDELRAALREALARRWAAVDGQGATPAWRITVDVTRFESIPGQAARLEGQWTLAPARGAARTDTGTSGPAAPAVAGRDAPAAASVTCRVELHEPASGGTAALAEAHRRAVARLADQIGRQLRAAGRGEPLACAAADR